MHSARLWILPCVLVLVRVSAAFGQPIELEDYDQVVEFSGERIVRFILGDSPQYAQPDFNVENWDLISLPHDWPGKASTESDLAWYRFSFVAPEQEPKRSLWLFLGKIADFEKVYLNGTVLPRQASVQSAQELYDVPRRYELPAELLIPGQENTLAVRVENRQLLWGGMTSGPYRIGGVAALGTIVDPGILPQVALWAMYVVIGLFMIALFLRTRIDRSLLTFGFFCLSITAYFFFNSEAKYLLLPDGYDAGRRLQFTALWMSFPLFLRFFQSFIGKKCIGTDKAYYALTAVLVAAGFFIPSIPMLSFMNTTIAQPSWLYPLARVIYLIVRSWRSNPEIRPITILFAVIVPFMFLDIAKAQNLIWAEEREFVAVYGFGVFVAGVALVILNRLAKLAPEVARLSQEANTDYLTGTAMRNHFFSVFRHELVEAAAGGYRLSVLMADLDHFKAVNDTYGHEAGDRVLEKVAESFKMTLRARDVVGRYGGEEFVILLPGTELKEALRIAERLREEVEQLRVGWKDHLIRCTVSIGAADLQGNHPNPTEAIHLADKAMYEAKKAGRNRVAGSESL